MSSPLGSRTDRTPDIWILHRSAPARAALERMLAVGGAATATTPEDPELDTLPAPRVVLLGLGDDVERELELAHRLSERLRPCRWLLVPDATGHAATERDRELLALFDTVDACVLSPPHSGAQLRSALRDALAATASHDALSVRRYRTRLRERFERWFAHRQHDELLRVLDPKLATVPLVLRGEPGTGRALVARYVHTFAAPAGAEHAPVVAFVELDCAAARDELDLLRPIANSAGAPYATLLLEGLEQLDPSLRGSLIEWIEYGLPPRIAAATRVRWAASLPPAGADPDTDPDLLAALSGLQVSLAPLREQREAIAPFAAATVAAWSTRVGRPPRALSDATLECLADHDWPGNLRELEGMLMRALAEHSDDPLEPHHLGLEAGPLGAAPVAQRAQPAPEPGDVVTVDDGPVADLEAAAAAGDDVAHEDEPVRRSERADAPGGGDSESPVDTSGSAAAPPSASGDDDIIDLGAGDLLDDEDDAIALAEDDLVDEDLADDDDGVLDLLEPVGADPADEDDPIDALFEGLERGDGAPTPEGTDDAADDDEEEFEDDELLEPDYLDDLLLEPVYLDEDEGEPATPQPAGGAAADPGKPADTASPSRPETVEPVPVVRTPDVAPPPRLDPVDTTALIESQLTALRGEVARRNLVVLKELDRENPVALANAVDLRLGLRGLLSQLVMRAQDRGDFYIASHHNPEGLAGKPSLRLLIRQLPGGDTPPGMSSQLRLELARGRKLAEAAGGHFALSEGTAGELVVMFDLPAPPSDASADTR